jgi:choline dehydrogenase-like flavoprotein
MILESMQSQGLPLQEDMFTSGDNPHGCGHAPRTVYKGDRTTAANYFVNKGPNLAIKTETTVDKVILGTEKEIRAKKEIIVSGGAYCSPAILLRSGIGPKSELASHGIDCKVDLPGVGKNLMDHLVSYLFTIKSFYELTDGVDRLHFLRN